MQAFDATCLESFLIDMLKQDNKHAFFWLTQLSKVRKEGYGMLEASLAEKERLRERSASVSPPWKAGCTGCKGRRAPRASGLKVFRRETSRNAVGVCLGYILNISLLKHLTKEGGLLKTDNSTTFYELILETGTI